MPGTQTPTFATVAKIRDILDTITDLGELACIAGYAAHEAQERFFDGVPEGAITNRMCEELAGIRMRLAAIDVALTEE